MKYLSVLSTVVKRLLYNFKISTPGPSKSKFKEKLPDSNTYCL